VNAGQDLALGEGTRRALHLALRIGQGKVDHRGSMKKGGPMCRPPVVLRQF
jgi:hypothetical protein